MGAMLVFMLCVAEYILFGAGPWCDLSSSPSNLRYWLPSNILCSSTTEPQPSPSLPVQMTSPPLDSWTNRFWSRLPHCGHEYLGVVCDGMRNCGAALAAATSRRKSSTSASDRSGASAAMMATRVVAGKYDESWTPAAAASKTSFRIGTAIGASARPAPKIEAGSMVVQCGAPFRSGSLLRRASSERCCGPTAPLGASTDRRLNACARAGACAARGREDAAAAACG
mmetsp:Transcript_21559/g.67651  ORF Transcript_21559/g.67651 Transcript_21559/m.67651 type:complete len:226 (+) Transcript_21559:744-1421(+)